MIIIQEKISSDEELCIWHEYIILFFIIYAEQFGCLVWSHSETHLLYVAEKKRPKTESYFQVS